MEQTVCKTYFSIMGEFELEEVSIILAVKNTSGHSIGEKKRYGPGVFEWAAWEYGTEYEQTLLADEQAKLVIKPLMEKTEELRLIKERYNCRFVLRQVPKVENGNTPALVFDKEIIDFCSTTGTEIEIDLYVNPYNDDNVND